MRILSGYAEGMLVRRVTGACQVRVRSGGVLGVLFLAGSLGCGGEAEYGFVRGTSSGGPSVPSGPVDAGPPQAPEAPVDEEPEEPESPPFVDPGCPEQPPERDVFRCDPWSEPSGCESGLSCFPIVIYPNGPCDVERVGAVCGRAGSAGQGESCLEAACAPGFLCVSTGRGTSCAQMCQIDRPSSEVCPRGLLCQPIDIDGFGGCL